MTELENFLWHKVSEKEKVKIKEEAKKIIDSFTKELERIEKKKIPEWSIERKESEREESVSASECDSVFKDLMFSNAPKKNKDFIIAEKGEW